MDSVSPLVNSVLITSSGPDTYAVGERFLTRWRTVTESDLVSFSAWTRDWHPLHSDAVWAAASGYGQRVAHGMLVLSYAVGLIELDPERVQGLRGLRDVVFKRPVYIGSTIGVTGEITEARPIGETTLLTLLLKVHDPDQKTFLRASLEVLVRPAKGAGS